MPKIEEGTIFSSASMRFEVRMEIVFLDDLNDYARIECTKKTNGGFKSWGEDWTYVALKEGFKSRDLRKLKFKDYPITYKERQNQR